MPFRDQGTAGDDAATATAAAMPVELTVGKPELCSRSPSLFCRVSALRLYAYISA